ncbi:MAG: hypothetical protein WA803_08840 [Steroidobacteraceae bacterium]
MPTTGIGSVPKVRLGPAGLPSKSKFLYRSMDALGLRVSNIPVPIPRGAVAPNAIVGAEARYRDIEYADRGFVDIMRERYQDEESTFEFTLKKTDQMLNDYYETLLGMNHRVLDITKVMGAKPVQLPPPQRLPTRPQECLAAASGEYSFPSYAGEHVKDHTANHKMNLMKAIHRRLWKYDLRMAHHWKSLKRIEERLDDRLGLLRQRLGWAEELTGRLADVEKELRSLAPAAVKPKIPVKHVAPLFGRPPPNYPTILKSSEYYEDATSQSVPLSYRPRNLAFDNPNYYAHRHVPDPEVDAALTFQLHYQCAMIQSKQRSLWDRLGRTLDWIGRAYVAEVKRQSRIGADFTETAARLEAALQALEAKAGIANRPIPKVHSLVQFHAAQIEKAGLRR